MGPESDAILVAIVLSLVDELRSREAAHPDFVHVPDPPLEERLRAARNDQWPPVSYAKIVDKINTDYMAWAADRYGLEPRVFGPPSASRWVDHYKIPPARWEPAS